MTAEALPHGAFDPIAIDRACGRFAGNRQAQARPLQFVGCDQYGESPTRKTLGASKHPPKVGGSGQARSARETCLTLGQSAGD